MKKKYTIKIEYTTGNSFNSERLSENLEFEWQNIEMAKANLKRIKNHYEFYMEYNNTHKKPDVTLLEGVIWNDKYRSICLELINDERKPFSFGNFWTGYFETLHSIEVVAVVDEDMKIEFD